jgi:hypothetical protein
MLIVEDDGLGSDFLDVGGGQVGQQLLDVALEDLLS